MSKIHPTAEVDERASIGADTQIWHYCQIRGGARLGSNCKVGRGVFIDADVDIGDNVKIQNFVSIYHGVSIEDGVFIGPQATFTNDLAPRAVNPDGSPKNAQDWVVTPTRVGRGASIGANATVVCGTNVGRWALVGAGSVVTRDVEEYALVVGNPARRIGWVCASGNRHDTQESAHSCRICDQPPLHEKTRNQ
jgi:acetyltransferase-like isoleucine patch superfamily enzyme